MRRIVTIVTTTCALASLAAVLLSAQQAPQPTFRSGTDIVQLDVFVWDKDRKPVHGLTAADFTVLEKGKPQVIESMSEVTLPPRVAPTAPWLADVAPDVVSNAQVPRRLIVIAIDDARMGSARMGGLRDGQTRGARQAAHAVIDQLGPTDQAAVVFSSPGHLQEFTTDRTRLRASVESLQPRNFGSQGPPLQCTLQVNGCVYQLFKRVADILGTAPSGPRLVVFISEQTIPRELLAEVIKDLQAVNANVYPIDPRGLSLIPPDPAMRTLAEETGGRETLNTNAVWQYVPGIFEASQSYYAMGYRSNDSRTDGQFRTIEIKVNRPGLTVQTRSGYEGPKATERANRAPVELPVDTALSRGLPSSDIPLQVTTLVTSVPGAREAMVAGIVTVTDPSAGDLPSLTQAVTLAANAYNPVFNLSDQMRMNAEWTIGAADAHDLVARLRLAPGRYQVRFAVERDGRAGSVYVDVDVPDFAKEPLSASSLIVSLGSVPAARIDLDPGAPLLATGRREFSAAESPAVIAEFYQGGKDATAPVTLTTRIVDAQGRTVVEETTSLPKAAFDADRMTSYEWALPLARLQPGPHLLRIEATKGKARVVRQLRFTVVDR